MFRIRFPRPRFRLGAGNLPGRDLDTADPAMRAEVFAGRRKVAGGSGAGKRNWWAIGSGTFIVLVIVLGGWAFFQFNSPSPQSPSSLPPVAAPSATRSTSPTPRPTPSPTQVPSTTATSAAAAAPAAPTPAAKQTTPAPAVTTPAPTVTTPAPTTPPPPTPACKTPGPCSVTQSIPDTSGLCITQDLSGFTGTVSVSGTNAGGTVHPTTYSSNGTTEPGFSWTVPSGGSDTVCIVATGPPSGPVTVTFTGTSS